MKKIKATSVFPFRRCELVNNSGHSSTHHALQCQEHLREMFDRTSNVCVFDSFPVRLCFVRKNTDAGHSCFKCKTTWC